MPSESESKYHQYNKLNFLSVYKSRLSLSADCWRCCGHGCRLAKPNCWLSTNVFGLPQTQNSLDAPWHFNTPSSHWPEVNFVQCASSILKRTKANVSAKNARGLKPKCSRRNSEAGLRNARITSMLRIQPNF